MTRLVFADEHCTLWVESHALGCRRDAIRRFFGIQAEDELEVEGDKTLLSGSDAALTLLRGKIAAGSGWLRIMGGSMAISPLTSTVARRVVSEFGLDGCERLLTDAGGDSWRVPAAEMLGRTPCTLYHGTSTTRLASIRSTGLRFDMEANWDMGDQGGAHGDTRVVSLAAEANVAAMHAQNTAAKIGGAPVVLAVATPADLLADHDVMRATGAIDGKDKTAMKATNAVGLYATPSCFAPVQIIEARNPTPYTTWISWPVAP
ncbi:hypothetical protein [Sphingomonas sp. PvP018]|jgi:hypothetical protein|uniref:hypothetical protein n=1 Tax=Sphingomonas sp. PvP018 TaxID=2817852 RepID=UPI001AE64960|nr:hypothetical protein [Sphingomonas sp. PvP018]MBP2513807.1 hypothetical protein [Sphingomonas sp. PvP018]